MIKQADVAEEIAWIIHKANVTNPHVFSIEYVERSVRNEMLRQTLLWYRWIFQ